MVSLRETYKQIQHDITERKLTQNEMLRLNASLEERVAQARELSASLGDSERHKRALLDNVGEGIVSISASGIR